MSQKRYINFGTPADADKVKAISRQMFAPQVLRAEPPFMVASGSSQVSLSAHSVIFENGVILEEDETLLVDIETGFASRDTTIFYEHVDEDQVGGSPALLDTEPGLLTTRPNSVILGWVRYPGGSVALDSSMLFESPHGQVNSASHSTDVVKSPSDGLVVASYAGLSSDNPITSLVNVIPASPHQIVLPDLVVSKRIALESDQQIRVYSRDDVAYMSRVTAGPASGEFSLNTTTGTFTFAAADEGKAVDISDITYGGELVRTSESLGATATEDVLFTFPVGVTPIKSVSFEFVTLSGYTIDLLEVMDTTGAVATTVESKVEPTSPDGTVSRLVARLLSGSFQGSNGQQFTVMVRKTLSANGEGLLLSARASSYDLPF